MTIPTAADLITEHQKLKDHVSGETKRFEEYIKPHKERMEEINNQLLAMLNAQGIDSISSDAGTAYKSTLLNTKVENREALLDYANDYWEVGGGDLLLIGVQKDAVKNYMEENAGKPPPGVTISYFTRINIRKS